MLYAKLLLRLSVWSSKTAKVSPEFLARQLDRLTVRLAYLAISKSGHSICKCKGCSRS